MTDSSRFRTWSLVTLVLLAGGVLAAAWWDWTYPDQVVAWWNGARVYRFYWRQLGWALLISEGAVVSLWLLSVCAHSSEPGRRVRAARPFLLAFLALAFFARYTYHPLGVQSGSSVWTYGLVAVTAAVVALPLTVVLRLAGVSRYLHRRGWALAYVFAALYALVFGLLSVSRHASLRTHALDLGTMDQTAWNTIHGRVLERTPLYRAPREGTRYENRLLDAKLELVFIPLSALYWLWSDPRILLIVQTLFLAAGALPLYRLVYERGSGEGAALRASQARSALSATLLSVAYLLYLPLHYVNMADFHPSALMVPLLIAAWRAMTLRRWRQYYLWLVLAASCRIDAAFATLALGILVAIWRKGQARHGLCTLFLAIAWLTLDFGVIVPAVRQAYGPGAGDLVVRRFGMLGSSPLEMIRTVVTRPAFVAARLVDREKLQVVVNLLAPLGLSPFLAPLGLLPALPVLAINLLAESTWQNSIHAHYMAPVIPFLWIAAGEGVAWLVRRRRLNGALSVSAFGLVNTLLVSLVFSPFPPGKAFHLSDFYQPSVHQESLRAVITLIPDDASVCAQSDIHPHISQRRDALLFPRCRLADGVDAEYVVLDVDSSATKSPVDYHAFYELVGWWLEREEFGVVAQEGGALLLRRGAPRDNIPGVLAALDRYGRGFYRVDYLKASVPRRLSAGELYRVPITLRNTGPQSWSSTGQLPVRLSYRWWTDSGALFIGEALRTDLPHRVEPGHEVRLRAWLLAPSQQGQYALEWDVVREGDAWFSDKGGMVARQEVTIE